MCGECCEAVVSQSVIELFLKFLTVVLSVPRQWSIVLSVVQNGKAEMCEGCA